MARKKSHYQLLRSKWVRRHRSLQKKLWRKHQESLDWLKNSSQQVAVGSLASLLLLTQPAASSILAQSLPPPVKQTENPNEKKTHLIADLLSVLPQEVQSLTSEQEQAVGQVLSQSFNLPVSAELQGKRLNRSYGIIGAEQHLMRYPGDTMASHFDTAEEAKFYSSGMAPGRGAWGYFASSATAMTETDKQREKYYIAVQTFLSPGWKENVRDHYAFYKFRKMLVVNPENGKAIVAVIGDAGPAEWTGKHLGGSPEVMGYLDRQDGAARGPVLYFFIDDPEDQVPLGPIAIQ